MTSRLLLVGHFTWRNIKFDINTFLSDTGITWRYIDSLSPWHFVFWNFDYFLLLLCFHSTYYYLLYQWDIFITKPSVVAFKVWLSDQRKGAVSPIVIIIHQYWQIYKHWPIFYWIWAFTPALFQTLGEAIISVNIYVRRTSLLPAEMRRVLMVITMEIYQEEAKVTLGLVKGLDKIR